MKKGRQKLIQSISLHFHHPWRSESFLTAVQFHQMGPARRVTNFVWSKIEQPIYVSKR